MATELVSGGASSPVVQLRKWLLPVPHRGPTAPLVISAWAMRSSPTPWLQLQNAVWQFESARTTYWDEAWFAREFSRLGHDQYIWTVESWSGQTRGLVGSVSLDLHNRWGSEAVINWLAVLPEFRCVGVGTALMAHAEHQAWRRGRAVTRVETLSTWKPAIAFYQRLGYGRVE